MSALSTTHVLCQFSLLHKFYVISHYYTSYMSVLIIRASYMSFLISDTSSMSVLHYKQVPYED